MYRRMIMTTASVTAIALLLGALGRGTWLHQVVSVSVLLWIGLPVLLLLLAALIRRQFFATLVGAATLWFIGLQLMSGLGFLLWDISVSQRYCESLVPILDAVYSETGQYPLSLAGDARLMTPRPAVFGRSLVNYYSDGATFSFEVSNPAEIFGGFTFDHDDRRWSEWRD
jgi:hypothetical protein